jgi:peroxiredoxin Q/BCP
MIKEQQAAPDFTVRDQDNNTVRLSDFSDKKNVVLYFYPKDDTHGCTIEANEFTRYIEDFSANDTVVYGVSKDSCASHVEFIDKYGLRVGLLADTDGVLCDAYGVWQEKEKNGEKKMGIVRSTFVIDKTGTVRFAEYGVVPDGHAMAVLEKIKQL